MTSFKLAFHDVNGRRIVEVWHCDEFIAGIYPSDDRSFNIVSKHEIDVTRVPGFPIGIKVEIGD